MDLGEVFSSSWKVFWKYKLLWLFEIVPYLIFALPAAVVIFFMFSPQFLSGNANSIFGTGLLIFDGVYLVLIIVYAFVYVLADASVVKGTLLFDQKGDKLPAGELIKQSWPYYWRVFGLLALFVGAFIVVYLVMVAIMMAAMLATAGLGMFCLFPLFILFIPLMYLAITFLELSRTAILQENTGLGECLKRTWALFKARFWQIVLLALVLYFGMGIVVSILYIPLYAVFFIPILTSMTRNPTNPQDVALQFLSTFRWAFAIFFPIFLLVSGILITFVHEAWAIAYLRLSRQPAAAVPPAAPLQSVTGVQ